MIVCVKGLTWWLSNIVSRDGITKERRVIMAIRAKARTTEGYIRADITCFFILSLELSSSDSFCSV